MGRKTTQDTVRFPRPYATGPRLIDQSGDDITEDSVDAVRIYPVGDEGEGLSNVVDVMDKQLQELRRIRLSQEIIIGDTIELEKND